MARIAREIPELAGKLSAPRVTYVRSLRKTYITFESTVLAGEKQFLQMEKLLKELFPGRPLAVRIISPGLRNSFLEDPMEYRQVLDDFLRRNYPAARGWVGQIGWQIEKNQLSGNNLPAGEEEALLRGESVLHAEGILLHGVLKKLSPNPNLINYLPVWYPHHGQIVWRVHHDEKRVSWRNRVRHYNGARSL